MSSFEALILKTKKQVSSLVIILLPDCFIIQVKKLRSINPLTTAWPAGGPRFLGRVGPCGPPVGHGDKIVGYGLFLIFSNFLSIHQIYCILTKLYA